MANVIGLSVYEAFIVALAVKVIAQGALQNALHTANDDPMLRETRLVQNLLLTECAGGDDPTLDLWVGFCLTLGAVCRIRRTCVRPTSPRNSFRPVNAQVNTAEDFLPSRNIVISRGKQKSRFASDQQNTISVCPFLRWIHLM